MGVIMAFFASIRGWLLGGVALATIVGAFQIGRDVELGRIAGREKAIEQREQKIAADIAAAERLHADQVAQALAQGAKLADRRANVTEKVLRYVPTTKDDCSAAMGLIDSYRTARVLNAADANRDRAVPTQ